MTSESERAVQRRIAQALDVADELIDELAEIERRLPIVVMVEAATVEKKDASLKTTILAGIFALAVAAIGVAPTLLAGSDKVPVSCGDERAAVAETWRENGRVWTELPETSPTQQQCKINEYVIDLESNESD